MQLLPSLAKCLTSIGPACLQILLGISRNTISLWRTLEPMESLTLDSESGKMWVKVQGIV